MHAAAPPDAPYTVRPATPADLAFLVGPWLESWKHESAWAHRVTAPEFYPEHRGYIIGILEHAEALVACDVTDPDALVGAMVYEPHHPRGPVLDWVFTKKAFRGLGIARALLAASGLPPDLAGVRLSHCTRSWFGSRIHGPGLEAKFPKAIHSPYRAWRYPPAGVTA